MDNFQIKRLAVIMAMGSGMAASMPVMADTFSTTATVSNTITLTETTPLNFGSLFAIVDPDDDDTTLASVTISPAGGMTTGAATDCGVGKVSNIVPLGGHSAGQLDVTGAAAFTALTVTSGAGLVDLVHSSGSPTAAIFTLDTITTNPATTTTGLTDASGNLTITVGGTISAVQQGSYSSGYLDGTYTGSYDVSVSY